MFLWPRPRQIVYTFDVNDMKHGYKAVLLIFISCPDLTSKNLLSVYNLAPAGILLVRHVGKVVVCLYILRFLVFY